MSFLGVMLAQEFEPHRITYPVAVEAKLDGFRVVHVDGQGYTRNGNTYETLMPFARILREAVGDSGIHVDTEMMSNVNWNETSKLLKRLKNVDVERIKNEVTAHVFDVFSAATLGVETYQERRRAVEWAVDRANAIGGGYTFKATDVCIAHSREDVSAAFDAYLTKGYEGIIVKPLDGVYTLKRSYAFLKAKPFEDITVTIVGGEHAWGQCPICMPIKVRELRGSDAPDPHCDNCDGTGEIAKSNELGSLHCETERSAPVKVGMGFTDAQRIEFWKDLPNLIGKKIDVKVQKESGANEIIARHPCYMRMRPDLDLGG